MALSKQRKAYVAILLVAAGFLTADRFILGTGATVPATAAAEPLSLAKSVSNTTGAPAAQIAQQPGTPASSLPQSLATRLERLRDSAADALVEASPQLIDPFTSPPALAAIPAMLPAEQAALVDNKAEEFSRMHRLTAVMRSAADSSAVIGGRIYRVGDSLDGLTLIEIDRRSATFVGENDLRVTLAVGTMDGK
jgi:hypothetical protein